MTRKEKAEFMVRQLRAIGFDAYPQKEYGTSLPGEQKDENGQVYTGVVVVQQEGFGHGQIKDLTTFAEYHYRTLRLGGGTLYGGIQVVNVYVVEDA